MMQRPPSYLAHARDLRGSDSELCSTSSGARSVASRGGIEHHGSIDTRDASLGSPSCDNVDMTGDEAWRRLVLCEVELLHEFDGHPLPNPSTDQADMSSKPGVPGAVDSQPREEVAVVDVDAGGVRGGVLRAWGILGGANGVSCL